jgi:tetratricopeptide (TPR) repeat protein
MPHPFRAPRPALAAALLALVPACFSSGSKPDPEKQLSMHREFALRYYDANDLARAEQQADKGLELEPEDVQLRLMKGWIRQRRGATRDIFVAERIFRDLVDTMDYRATLGLAEALERKGVLYSEAADAVAAGKRPTDAPSPSARADELAREAHGAWRQSATWYEKTLEAKPGEFQAINGLQRVHALLGDYDESLRWSNQLLEQSLAEIAFWKTKLAQPELSAREEARLRTLLASSTRLQLETHLHASALLVRIGRLEEALAHLESVIAIDPSHSDAYSRRGQVLKGLGRYQEAMASLQQYLRLSTHEFAHPDIQRAYQLMSECELAQAPAGS